MSMKNRARTLLKAASADPTDVTPESVRKAIQTVSPGDVPLVMRALSITLKDDSSRAPALLDVLREGAAATDDETRLAASRGLVVVAITAPETLSEDLSIVIDRLDDEFSPVRAAGLRGLVWLSAHETEAIIEHVDHLAARLNDENPFVARTGLELISRLGQSHVEALEPTLEPIVDILRNPPTYTVEQRERWNQYHPRDRDDDDESDEHDDRDQHLMIAANAVAPIAVEHPKSMAPHVPDLVAVVKREEIDAVRYHLLEAIQAVAEVDPEAAADALDVAAGLFVSTDNDQIRENAAWTLTWLVAGSVDGVDETLEQIHPTIFDCLSSDQESDRGAALGLLSYYAERDPETVRTVLPDVRPQLEAGDPQHRGMAVWALAFAGESDDHERLIQIARGDPNTQVRSAADEALTILEDRIDE